MSKAMYDAICEIAENGERFPARELNVSARMVAALAKRGFIGVNGEHAFVTPAAWAAM